MGSTTMAQTNTWTGAGANANWNTALNWSLNALPTATNDVIIPTGSNVTINVAATVKSIVIQGSAVVDIANSLTFNNASSAGAASTVNWSSNVITGGSTFTNNGTFNLTSTNTKSLVGVTTFNNAGTFNITSSGDFYISDGIFNNQMGGVLDLQTDGGYVSYSGAGPHVLNNLGLIKKSAGAGSTLIYVELNNQNGTVSVETGNLNLTDISKNLTDGIYNVAADASLQWSSNVKVAGTLTGALDGEIAWTGSVTVPASTVANFNFSGDSGVSWSSGTLKGGGTLVNQNLIFLPSSNTKSIIELTNLNNEGDVNITDSGDLYISDGIFNNQASGVLDLQEDGGYVSYSGTGSHVFNNFGLIKKSAGTGSTLFYVELYNQNGTVTVETGNLEFNDISKQLTNGFYNVSSGASLQWSSNVNVAGSLEGVLNGEITWTGTVTVPATTTATFNFTGDSGVSWSAGNLAGGGTLVNESLIFLPSPNTKSIIGVTTLENQGVFNIVAPGDLYISDGTLNNMPEGILDLQSEGGYVSYSGNGTHILNNFGLLKRSTSTGNVVINSVLNNNDGIISVENGNLTFELLDKNLTDGTYNISEGSSLQWGSNTIVAGTLSGVLEGEIAWANTVTVPLGTTAIFDFTGSNGVSWSAGNLDGGGTLVNKNLIFLPSSNTKSILGLTTLSNDGNFNITDSGDLYISNGIFSNELMGVLDLQTDGGYVSYSGSGSHVFDNFGLIKKSGGTGNTLFYTELNNQNGTITVETGNLNLTEISKNLTNGFYNVASEASLQWSSNVNVAGTLSGNLEGEIAWTGTVTVPAPTIANFNFSGSNGVSWSSGTLTGGGTLVNQSLIFLSSSNTKSLIGLTNLNNEGDFNLTDNGDFYISNGIFNNQATGTLDLQEEGGYISYSGSGSHVLNNFGLLKKSVEAGNTIIYTQVNNSGIIDVTTGQLEFTNDSGLHNMGDGIIKGIGTIKLPSPAQFTNDGTFAPGGSPGILTVAGTYKSSSTAVLDIEINGLAQGTQYDVMAINGTNAMFDGTVNVTLGFAASLNDEFIIATTSGDITQCNLAPTTSAIFEDLQYNFSVTCRNANEVVLTVANITLGIDEVDLSEANIQLFPNPTRNEITLKNKSNITLTSATLMDVSGRVLSIIDLKSVVGDPQISLESYATGTYFLKIDAGNGSIVKQVLKK